MTKTKYPLDIHKMNVYMRLMVNMLCKTLWSRFIDPRLYPIQSLENKKGKTDPS